MSSRAEQKEAARRAREEAERAEAQQAARKRRLLTLGGVLAVALIVVGVAVAVSQSGSDDGGGKRTGGEVAALFAGIPQDGEWLGDPDAPVVVEEYADLQCPFCAQFSNEVLPTVIDDYVKTGRVRLRLRLLTFLGPDSQRAAGVAYAAAQQDRMWPFVDRFYANQGQENSGYATDAFLREQAEAVEGLDVDRAFEVRQAPAVTRQVDAATASAQRAQVESTPSFLAGPRGGDLQPLELGELTPEAFREAIDAVLADAR